MIGYTQATILGKVRGLKFGSLAAENITMELVALGAATGGNYSTSMITVIIYWGLYNNAWSKKEDIDFTFEQVSDWVDENAGNDELVGVFGEIAKCYEASTSTKQTIERLEQKLDEIKKKDSVDLGSRAGWATIRGFATGKLGWTVDEYYNTTLADLILAYRAYNEKVTDEWRQTRLLMFTMARLWGDPKKPIHSPEELMQLPGDEMTSDIDEEEALMILRRMREAEEKQNNGAVSES